MTRRAALVLTVAAALAGCATVPNVVYHRLGDGGRQDSWIPFRLTDSVVVIGAPGEGKDAAPVSLAPATVRCPQGACGAIAVTAVPTDFRDDTYALEPKSRRFISTTAAPTYVANSLRFKVLTIEAKDHRLEAINTVATLAAGAARMAAGDLSNADPTDTTAELHLPVTLALADLRCVTGTNGCNPVAPRALPGNPGWTWALAFADDPRRDGLLDRHDIGAVHAAMVASACRRARITLTHAEQAVTVDLATDVADPDWLVAVPFPTKGAMTFHPLCGVDVQAQAVTEIGVDTMATAFVNGVQQVTAKQKR